MQAKNGYSFCMFIRNSVDEARTLPDALTGLRIPSKTPLDKNFSLILEQNNALWLTISVRIGKSLPGY